MLCALLHRSFENSVDSRASRRRDLGPRSARQALRMQGLRGGAPLPSLLNSHAPSPFDDEDETEELHPEPATLPPPADMAMGSPHVRMAANEVWEEPSEAPSADLAAEEEGRAAERKRRYTPHPTPQTPSPKPQTLNPRP